jgi:Flp pilus assembly protein TadG
MSDLAKKKFTQLLENNKGNFAIMAALTVPVVFIAASLAVDTTNAMSMKIRLQNAVDSAALATSTRLAQEEGSALMMRKPLQFRSSTDRSRKTCRPSPT